MVAGAALFLGETVGWRRWASILVGFLGVLVILEPWGAAFDPTGLLTVTCVLADGASCCAIASCTPDGKHIVGEATLLCEMNGVTYATALH
mgnify:CR=1 FL=1